VNAPGSGLAFLLTLLQNDSGHQIQRLEKAPGPAMIFQQVRSCRVLKNVSGDCSTLGGRRWDVVLGSAPLVLRIQDGDRNTRSRGAPTRQRPGPIIHSLLGHNDGDRWSIDRAKGSACVCVAMVHAGGVVM